MSAESLDYRNRLTNIIGGPGIAIRCYPEKSAENVRGIGILVVVNYKDARRSVSPS